MMGGGAFILLKAGHPGGKSAKQAENRLAGLPKILYIAGPEGEHLLAKYRDHMQGLYGGRFPRDMANLPEIAHPVI